MANDVAAKGSPRIALGVRVRVELDTHAWRRRRFLLLLLGLHFLLGVFLVDILDKLGGRLLGRRFERIFFVLNTKLP